MNITELVDELHDELDGFANCAVIVKIDDRIVFEKNLNVSFPAASLIKLPILACAMENLNFEDLISLKKSNIVGGAGVLQILQSGEFTVSQILGLMISVSDNTAANLIINELGMKKVNSWLQGNGFPETHLNRYLMDVSALEKGIDNRTTASEALRLLELISKKADKQTKDWFLNQQARYKLPGAFDELGWPIQVFNKTGEGNGVDHDVARFITTNHITDVAVLSTSQSDRTKTLQMMQQVGLSIANYELDM